MHNFLSLKETNDKIFDLFFLLRGFFQSEMDEVKLHCFILAPGIDASHFPPQAMS